ncbi:hypothetical protein SNF32_08500 [Enterococcus mundtii]|nr:hypothetical protein [Enterococcus mundtii]
MNLIKLGEPIKLGKFLFQYEEMIRHVLNELSFVDLNDPKVKILLKAELRRAENSFYTFYERNRREPDYAYLQEMVTNFGVNRIQYFQPEMNILSLDNFVHGHIERLKLDKLLSGLVFDSQDLILLKNTSVNVLQHTLKRMTCICVAMNRNVFQSIRCHSRLAIKNEGRVFK